MLLGSRGSKHLMLLEDFECQQLGKERWCLLARVHLQDVEKIGGPSFSRKIVWPHYRSGWFRTHCCFIIALNISNVNQITT